MTCILGLNAYHGDASACLLKRWKPAFPASVLREVLGWKPRHEKLADIVRTAWNWYCAHTPA